jgi:hypothetical protein
VLKTNRIEGDKCCYNIPHPATPHSRPLLRCDITEPSHPFTTTTIKEHDTINTTLAWWNSFFSKPLLKAKNIDEKDKDLDKRLTVIISQFGTKRKGLVSPRQCGSKRMVAQGAEACLVPGFPRRAMQYYQAASTSIVEQRLSTTAAVKLAMKKKEEEVEEERKGLKRTVRVSCLAGVSI